jgi:acetyl-CoA C-acetyltransferase
MDLIELNEAFAARGLAVTREWNLARTTSTGSTSTARASPSGHPSVPPAAGFLATPAQKMLGRQVRYGQETMCIGGGQGVAAVFERVG